MEETQQVVEAPNEDEIVAAYLKKKRRRVIIAAAVVVLLAALAGLAYYAASIGALAPSNAAAKYAGFNYITEDEVTEYINTYREQMGYGEDDVDDITWATFLSQYNLTPSILRQATITQLIYDKLVRVKCSALGLEVTEAEVDAVIEAAKETYAFGDDEIWVSTLEGYGQTEEGYRETVELQLLKEKLYASQVETREADDDSTVTYISSVASSLDDSTVKHSYYFTLSYDEDTEYEVLSTVEDIRDTFAAGSMTMSDFVTLVVEYCDDDDLVEAGGAMGWTVDSSDMSTTYLQVIDPMEAGDVSAVFVDDGTWGFIWVDETFTFPDDEDELAALGEEDLPETLWEYFQDYAAYILWQNDCELYLASLYEDSDVVIFDIPEGLPYDVDMSLALTDDEDEDATSEDETEDATEAEDASDEDSE